MYRLFLAIAASLVVNAMQAQDLTIKLWDNASAPHSNNLTTPEKDEGEVRYSSTTEAVLYIWEARREVATGQAVVICPGGGYFLVAMGHEGFEFAEWLAENGITAAVLKYRMPNHQVEVPMEDAAEALRYMREDYRHHQSIKQLGIMGFSAGGHLAASTAVGALKINGDKSARAAIRPDFALLFYPVITGNAELTHKGSYDNLLGENRSQTLTDSWSPELIAEADTPPTLLLLSDDDTTVPPANSIKFYSRLKQLGIPASMHIFPSGGHGWGFRDSLPYKPMWQQMLLDWLSKVKE